MVDLLSRQHPRILIGRLMGQVVISIFPELLQVLSSFCVKATTDTLFPLAANSSMTVLAQYPVALFVRCPVINSIFMPIQVWYVMPFPVVGCVLGYIQFHLDLFDNCKRTGMRQRTRIRHLSYNFQRTTASRMGM